MTNLISLIKNGARLGILISLFAGAGLFTSCTTTEASLADKKNYTEDDSQYKRLYNVQFEEGEKPLRYGYHYVVSKMPDSYLVRVFHPDKKTLIEEKVYSTPSLTLLHGPYSSYWDDGSIRSRGIYQFGRKHGTWLECEPGKAKSSTGPYRNQKKDGSWTQLDTNGLIESVFTWKDGLRHGKFYEYDTSGHKVNEGIYRADTLVSELFKRTQIQKPYLKICQGGTPAANYLCSEASIIEQINLKLKYPQKARQMGIEGSVIVQWDIMPDGSVQHLRVPAALSDEIETECLRVMRDMPEWTPARKDGVPVKWTMALPISFKL